MELDDPYSELCLTAGASDADVKAAWRRLSARWHPDRNPSPTHCTESNALTAPWSRSAAPANRRTTRDTSRRRRPVPRRRTHPLSTQCGGQGHVHQTLWFSWLTAPSRCNACEGRGSRVVPCSCCEGSGQATPFAYRSRLMVDGARTRSAAIERIDSPATKARDTSSRSANVSARCDRQRCAGCMPPVSARMRITDEWFRSNNWAICWRDSPFFQRSHIWAFWLSEYKIRGLRFICNTPSAHAGFSVLHRSVESATRSRHRLSPLDRLGCTQSSAPCRQTNPDTACSWPSCGCSRECRPSTTPALVPRAHASPRRLACVLRRAHLQSACRAAGAERPSTF